MDNSPVFACNLTAIGAAERPRYSELVRRVRAAMQERTEIVDGYSFILDGKAVTFTEAAEWITMERLCCPFLTLQISTTGDRGDWTLTLTGQKGVKPIIEAEFPVSKPELAQRGFEP